MAELYPYLLADFRFLSAVLGPLDFEPFCRGYAENGEWRTRRDKMIEAAASGAAGASGGVLDGYRGE